MSQLVDLKIMPCLLQWDFGAKFRKNVAKMIMIHHALHPNCTISDVHVWHLARGWNGFGYHYFIDRNGIVWAGRRHEWEGAHCKGKNLESYGICLEGCYTEYKSYCQRTVPGKQLASLVALCIMLNKPIAFHRDYTKLKDCPGRYFPEKTVINKLITNEKKALSGNTNLRWLKDEGLIKGQHNPLDPVNWNDFGVVLKRLQNNIRKEIRKEIKNETNR